MSEYQYYEFLAVDRPLSSQEMGQLRAISTRATITPTSFTNHYEWGDLKADPLELLRRYFDVFVYVANWGTRWIALRIPKEALPVKRARPYLTRNSGGYREAGDVAIVSLSSEDEHMEEWDEGTGWMASLAPVRGELLRGDLRPLYLAWLATAQEESLADEELEPPLPPGLGQLSPAQMRLAEFLRVDPYLLGVATEGSANVAASTDGLNDWIAALPASEKNRLLVSVAMGSDGLVGADLFRRFQAARAAPPAMPQRTVGELLEVARVERERHERERARRAEEERRRQEEAAAKAREERLTALAARQDAAWEDIERLALSKKPASYDEAVALLCDLREVADRAGTVAAFAQQLAGLRDRHARKVTLMERMRKARLTS
jgi:hypothetical protein